MGVLLLRPHSHITGFDKKSNRTKHFVIFTDETEDSRGRRERWYTRGLAALLPTLLTISSCSASSSPSLPPLPLLPTPPTLKPSSVGQPSPFAGPGTSQCCPNLWNQPFTQSRELLHFPINIWLLCERNVLTLILYTWTGEPVVPPYFLQVPPYSRDSCHLGCACPSFQAGQHGLESASQRSTSLRLSLSSGTGFINKFLILIAKLHRGNGQLKEENLKSLLIWAK